MTLDIGRTFHAVELMQQEQRLIVDMMQAAGDADRGQRQKWRDDFSSLHAKVVIALTPRKIKEPE